jgi:predicted nucleotide-binding protein (sugar kinase/HSP70/actin superfamily)
VVFHKHYSLGDGQKELARQYAEKGLALLNSHAAPASSWSGTEQRRGEIREDLQRVLKKLDQTEKYCVIGVTRLLSPYHSYIS